MSRSLSRIPVTLEKQDVDDYLRILHTRRREVEETTGRAYRVNNRKVRRGEMLRLLDKRLARVLAAVDQAIDHATRKEGDE